jgi:hypothetical protein
MAICTAISCKLADCNNRPLASTVAPDRALRRWTSLLANQNQCYFDKIAAAKGQNVSCGHPAWT